MNEIAKIIFGSFLYGTATPNSDKDYKGVFLPDKKELLLGKCPKSINQSTNKTNEKNTSEDVDCEIYSLHYFLDLACKGETVAIDMLHAPKKYWQKYTPIWEELHKNRAKFYTKNLKALVGYCRTQAAKYGARGSRLSDAKNMLDFLYSLDDGARLKEVWDSLPTGEHIHQKGVNPNGLREIQVCGKIFQETQSTSLVIESLGKFYKNYGHRAKLAATNQGIDWKALSHAIRAAYQVKSIFERGDIIFPLPERKVLLKVKNGEMDYQSKVAPLLEQLIDECEELSEKSNLPEKVNRKEWDNFILNIYNREMNYALT